MKNPNYLQRKSFLLRLIKEKKKSLEIGRAHV